MEQRNVIKEALLEQLEILREKSREEKLTLRERLELSHEISEICYELRKEDYLY